MNIEREYIKELYGDIEKLEEEIQKLKETQNFEEQMETLKTERDMVYHQNKELSLQLETLKNFGKDNAEYVTSLEEENKELRKMLGTGFYDMRKQSLYSIRGSVRQTDNTASKDGCMSSQT